ncbi:MAG: HAD family hydrolase [Cyanobacteria bacterium SZAS-4]|nr:HAD family hydrolase [Cyanobacteria bacterium SZAS-4]
MIEAIIFDIDGTLVDSVDLHAHAWQDAFEHFGKNIDFQVIRDQIGKGGDQLLPTFLSKDEISKFGDQLKQYRGEHFKKHYLQKVKPFSKVRELFQYARKDNKKIAIGSSAHEDELQHYLKLCKIDDLVDAVTCADDADKSKPHPDIFEAALAKLGETPQRTIVIGDSPYDAEAANKISMRTIGVLCGGFKRETLEEAGVVEIFDSPTDLLQKYDQSILAKRID